MDRLGTVAIVGGGLAGATAARALRDEGFDGGLVSSGTRASSRTTGLHSPRAISAAR